MGTGQIWLDEMNCNGTETSLSECASPNAGIHDCSHSEDASVRCFTTGESHINFYISTFKNLFVVFFSEKINVRI